jgi:hypothetical protein
MSERAPELRELVGELDAAEEARLARVHGLLVAAGPPPEISPKTALPPEEPKPSVLPFPRRYRVAALGLAAALAVVLLGVGYALGRGTAREEAFTVPMTGPRGATAEIVVFAADPAGNWPMELVVEGLAPRGASRAERSFELWLTKDGELAASCGAFLVSATSATTEVPLNAPYRLRDFDGWVVVASGETTPLLRTTRI